MFDRTHATKFFIEVFEKSFATSWQILREAQAAMKAYPLLLR